jgi:hypothetical protein
MRRRVLVAFALAATAALATGGVVAAADPLVPTGERDMHGNVLEGVYNAANGQIGYIMTPQQAKEPQPVHTSPNAWAPIYVVEYPVGTTAATRFNCTHLPVENCPSHGDAVAAAAAAVEADVYGDGAIGHDHVLDFPGADDFNIAWEPMLVFITSKAAANEHLITDDAILAAENRGDVVVISVPDLTFNCAVVPESIWNRATPEVTG